MQEAKALMIVRNLVKPFLLSDHLVIPRVAIRYVCRKVDATKPSLVKMLSDAISTKISCASAYPYQTAEACACPRGGGGVLSFFLHT